MMQAKFHLFSFLKRLREDNSFNWFEVIIVYSVAIALFQFFGKVMDSIHSTFFHILLYFFALVYLPMFIVFLTNSEFPIDFLVPKRMKLELRLLTISGLLVLALVAAGYFLSDLWWKRLPQYDLLVENLPVIILYQIVVVSFSEEFFFRGYLQTRLTKEHQGYISFSQAIKLRSVYLSAGLFALFHYLLSFSYEELFVFFPGLLFALLRVMSGGIFVPILLHALCNISSILLAVFLTD